MKHFIAAIALAFIPTISAAATPLGVNFGCGSCGSGVTYGTGYTYDTATDIDTAYAAGVRTLRIGVKARRLENTPAGTIDPNVAGKLLPLIDHARAKGMTVIIDMHDYGSWFGATITSPDIQIIVDLWNRAFGKYKNDPGVMPSFMNEPHLISSANIWAFQQSWVSQMRMAGFTKTLVISGAGWSPLSGYASYGAQAASIKDPLNNLLHDGHAYFDFDGSGTHSDVMGLTTADLVNPVSFAQKVHDRFYKKLGAAFTNARNNHYRFLVGETALPNTDVGRAALPIIVKLYAENSDVIAQQTWFTYASWMQLPGYMFGLMQSRKPSILLATIAKAQ